MLALLTHQQKQIDHVQKNIPVCMGLIFKMPSDTFDVFAQLW